MNLQRNISDEELEVIERFLTAEMDEQEYATFKLKMEQDEDLKAKVQEVRLMIVAIGEAQLESKLQDFHRTVETKPRRSGKRAFLTGWYAAASVILLIGVALLIFFSRSNQGEKLFAAYYSPDPGLPTAMGHAEDYQFDRAMIDYKTGNYDGALKAWQELSAHTESDTLHYFIGSAFLAKKEPAKAIPHFEKVAANSNSPFADDANWYLALAHIKEGKTQEAISYLEKTSHEDRNALLSKLRKLE